MQGGQRKYVIFLKMDRDNEQKLFGLVIKWTDHYKCRKDFIGWRHKRIWQEDYQKSRIESIKKIVPNLKSKKILDLGCGMGGLVVALRKEGFDIVGVDSNLDYCEITKLRGKRYNLNVGVVNSMAENTPFKSNSFDLIMCNDVLEHVQSPVKVLRECKRILKENGKIIIDVTNRFGYIDHHYHLRFLNWLPRTFGNFITELTSKKDLKNFKDKQRLRDMHYFTMRGFEVMVRKIGFSSCLNLAKDEGKNDRRIFRKAPGFKAVFLRLYLSSWRYLLIK